MRRHIQALTRAWRRLRNLHAKGATQQLLSPAMSKEKIRSAYEQLAEKYNELIEHKPHNAYYDRPNTLSLLPDVSGKTVLDAACGPGKYAEILLERGAVLTGFDLSTNMIQLARERNGEHGHFFVHDMSAPLDMFADQSFDIVLCALGMDYVQEWGPVVREFHRVLKPGGVFVMSSEHPFFTFNYFQSKQYFETEPVRCTWRGFGEPVEIHSFRRPLGTMLSALTDNGFYIDKLLEPRPVPEFERYDARHFRELNEFPSFVCLRAVKKT